jgi:hypothetical protein
MSLDNTARVKWRTTFGSRFITASFNDQFQNEIFQLTVERHATQRQNLSVTRIKLTAWLTQATELNLLSVTVSLPGGPHPRFIDFSGKERALKDKAYFSAHQFVWCTWRRPNGSIVLRNGQGTCPLWVRRTSNGYDIEVVLNAAAQHPRWDYSKGQRVSTASPVYQVGEQFVGEFELVGYDADVNLIGVLPSFFPRGTAAAFVLTDHCDFDTAQKLAVFLDPADGGWLRRGLKITKGVFALSPLPDEPRKSDSLEDLPYRDLIEQLSCDGSEVANHALKHSGQLGGAQFLNALQTFNEQWRGRTWIDHGSYITYCYSQGAKHNPEFRLVEVLQRLDYNSLWSFHDVHVDAVSTLNMLDNANKAGGSRLLAILRNLLRLRWLVAAHHLRSILHRGYRKNVIIDFLMFAMARSKTFFINTHQAKSRIFSELRDYLFALTRFKQFYNRSELPYTISELKVYSEPLYTETMKTINNWQPGDLALFSTIETTHVQDIYTGQALKKLIDERGLHIGHTYILNSLPYINGIFVSATKSQLHAKWKSFLDILAAYVTEGKIWNPNMSELTHHLTALQRVRIEYMSSQMIRLTNFNTFAVTDFTFSTSASVQAWLAPGQVALSSVQHSVHWRYFTVTLPPRQYVEIFLSDQEQ